MFARRRWTLGVLLALTAVSFAALLSLGWRSLDRFHGTFREVLREACIQTAEEAADQLQREFKSSTFNLLEEVDHTAVRTFDTAKIQEVLSQRAAQFPLIDTFFVWGVPPPQKKGTQPFDGAVAFYPFWRKPPKGSEVAPTTKDGFFADAAMSAALLAEARRIAPLSKPGEDPGHKNWSYALVYLTVDEHVCDVIFHLLYDQRAAGNLRGFEGFFTDIGRLREDYFPRFVSSLKTARADMRTVPPMAISIMDEAGHEVARSGRSLATTFEAEERFPLLFFEMDLFDPTGPYRSEVRYWTVRTGYEQGSAAAIVAAESQQQRWTWLLVGVIGTVGIGSIGWAASRQAQLARMQKEFVASISHDLITPLAKIQLFAETLESGNAVAAQKAAMYQRRIRIQASKLSELIGALLDFSRYESSTRYQREEIDLRAVLANSIELFEDDLILHRVKLELVLPDGEVPVLANSRGLQQVFSNLITNALKYSPRDPFLRVTLVVSAGLARIEFIDHGLGIARRERRKIFRTFYRGSAAATTAASGSGIGLAIVAQVLRAHDGSIDVKSETGMGSTFTVELPIVS